jgi:N-acetylglucosaminyldiphosphoundecaprenol N-acetyl-beta-D-mannosaminyltransferase
MEHASKRWRAAYVTTPNAQHSILIELSAEYRRIYEQSLLCLPDGVSMTLGARIVGIELGERTPGVDLFVEICGAAAKSGLKVFFLGGREGAADEAARKLRKQFPKLAVATHCPPFGFEHDTAECSRTSAAIRTFEPHIVFVGLGAPKQEFWMAKWGSILNIPICIGVGGSFELTSGKIQRAPLLLQRVGLEWAYRLAMEPRRLWRRYLIGNLAYIAIVISHRLARNAVD